jgi:hypothetical protein
MSDNYSDNFENQSNKSDGG